MNDSMDSQREAERLVSAIASSIIGEIGRPGEAPDTPELARFFRVYSLDTEIGSGASFDQYFDWSSSSDVETIVEDLEMLGLEIHAAVTRKAIHVAFPDGEIPEFDAASLDMDWSDAQIAELQRLYGEVSDLHPLVVDKLADYARRESLLELPRFNYLAK